VFGFLKSSYQKIKGSLAKTGGLLGAKLRSLFKEPWTEESFEQLQQILYEADLGSHLSLGLAEELRRFWRKNPHISHEQLLLFLQKEALKILETPPKVHPKSPPAGEPAVILVVGVNGSGKTTNLAKLAHLYKQEGKKVLLAAGDTFRAAAIDQLSTWADRLQLPLIKSQPGGDPAAVAFDAITAAKARNLDLVLLDTAGRLQNKTDLMRELEKVCKVLGKVIPSAPHQTLLVLDVTTGQNALDQVEIFHSFTPLTGLLLAKLDGSAKGGIALAIYEKWQIPIQWVGVGEQIDDLMPFDPKAYVEGLFET
jgi:fused signal recognition particle receptor